MNPAIILVLALLVVIATKRNNGPDGLERWHFAAVMLGVLGPYVEYVLLLLGPGPYLQARHALFWCLPLLPVYACILSALLSVAVRQPWRELLPGVLIGMLLTVLLGMLTEEGVQPLALLSDVRVGLAWLHPLDFVLPGLAAFGLVMVLVFPLFNRDMARLALGCIAAYIAATAGLHWQANQLATRYAQAMTPSMSGGVAHVRVQPGGGSPLNWVLLVEESSGRLHLARINLGHATGSITDDQDDTEWATPGHENWEITPRFDHAGQVPLSPAFQRRIRLAWYGWLASPYAWEARDAVFSALAPRPGSAQAARLAQQSTGPKPTLVFTPPGQKAAPPAPLPTAEASEKNLCVRFRDVRVPVTAPQYLVCPGNSAGTWQRSRIFTVDGVPADSGDGAVSSSIVLPGHARELVPVFSVHDA